MQKRLAVLSVVMLAFTVMGMAGCSDTGYNYTIERKTVNGLPTVTSTETATGEAKVDAVDYGNRAIALTGPNGKTEIFSVSPAVRNFQQVKKGDTVKVEYSNRIFASVRKTTEMPTTQTISSVALAKLGDKPGITCWRKAIVEANVEAIDYTTRVVRLRTTTGDQMILTADPKLQDLDKVHIGDQVVFDYTEAVTITVE